MNAERAGQPDVIVRDGYHISIWIAGDLVVLRARPLGASHEPAALHEPALPSRSRLLVWGGRRGIIRDRVRPRTRSGRLKAWLLQRRRPTPEEQIDALANELLTAISMLEPATPDAWVARGEQVLIQPSPWETEGRYLSGRSIRSGNGTPARITIAAAALGVGAIGALLLLLAAAGSGSDGPIPQTAPTELDSTDGSQLPVDANTAEEIPDDASPRLARRSTVQPIASEPSAPAYVFVPSEEPDLRALGPRSAIARRTISCSRATACSSSRRSSGSIRARSPTRTSSTQTQRSSQGRRFECRVARPPRRPERPRDRPRSRRRRRRFQRRGSRG